MKIGNISIKKYNDKTELINIDINNMSMTGGRIYFQLEGSFYDNLPLERNNLYSVTSSIDEQSPINFTGLFEDYSFNAGASDYYDQEGVHHSGIVTLNNRLQFLKV